MQKDFPIFISSADSYDDLWPVFFDFFKMNWPEFDGTIYLNTEEKEYKHEGLNIHCTQVGKLGSFGKVFRAGLDQLPSDHLLLIMIDYLLMGKVNDKDVYQYYDFFLSSNLDSLCLVNLDFREVKPTNSENIDIVCPPTPNMFSYQIAFWNKKILYQMALPHENPWTSEWYGTKRANKMNIKLGCLSKKVEMPIPYDQPGCVHTGKWLGNAIEYLQKMNYSVDFTKRGIYEDLPLTIKKRIKAKWMFVKDGLLGSYWKN